MNAHILIAPLVLASAAAVGSAPATQSVSPPNAGDPIVIQTEGRLWSFSGTARYYDDYFEEERSMYVGGLVEADSRSEALKLAREAGHARAALRGRVIAVYIRTLW